MGWVCSSSICSNRMSSLSPPPIHHHRRIPASTLLISSTNGIQQQEHRPRTSLTVCSTSKSTGFSLNSIFKKCETCGGQGAIECPGCKGSGKNKKNGNIFERWKCYDCQGFGLKGCPTCGKGGLTPEQRGER